MMVSILGVISGDFRLHPKIFEIAVVNSIKPNRKKFRNSNFRIFPQIFGLTGNRVEMDYFRMNMNETLNSL